MQARSISQAYLKHLHRKKFFNNLNFNKFMAKYKPIDMVDHYRGKICSHSDTYFQKRGKTLCTGRICKPRNLDKDPYSSAEIAVHNKFSQVIEAIKSLTEEQKAAYKTAFDKQSKYTSLRGYMFAKEYEKLGN
jgi:hypothetical protein